MKIVKHEERKASKEFICWMTGELIQEGETYFRTEGYYMGRSFQLKSNKDEGKTTKAFLLQNRTHDVWKNVFNKTRTY